MKIWTYLDSVSYQEYSLEYSPTEEFLFAGPCPVK